MNLRNIGARRQADSKLMLMRRFQIILRQTLPDLAGSAANYRVLVGVVIGIAVEHRNTHGSFLEAIEMVVRSLLDNVAQESGTSLA